MIALAKFMLGGSICFRLIASSIIMKYLPSNIHLKTFWILFDELHFM